VSSKKREKLEFIARSVRPVDRTPRKFSLNDNAFESLELARSELRFDRTDRTARFLRAEISLVRNVVAERIRYQTTRLFATLLSIPDSTGLAARFAFFSRKTFKIFVFRFATAVRSVLTKISQRSTIALVEPRLLTGGSSGSAGRFA